MTNFGQAIQAVWLILSAASTVALAAALVLPEAWVLAIGGILQTPHADPCPLCGMTRAFLAIARGQFVEAAAANAAALPLAAGLGANALLALGFGWTWGGLRRPLSPQSKHPDPQT